MAANGEEKTNKNNLLKNISSGIGNVAKAVGEGAKES